MLLKIVFFTFACRKLSWKISKTFYFVLFQMLKMKKHEELETPTFTTSIPIDITE